MRHGRKTMASRNSPTLFIYFRILSKINLQHPLWVIMKKGQQSSDQRFNFLPGFFLFNRSSRRQRRGKNGEKTGSDTIFTFF